MKNTKKFAAMIAALTLTACSIAPMFSFATDRDALTKAGQEKYDEWLEENTDKGEDETTVDKWALNITDATLRTEYGLPELPAQNPDEQQPQTPAAPTAEAGKIKFTGETAGTHKYVAYKIFSGTAESATGNKSGFNGSSEAKLNDPAWTCSDTDAAAFIAKFVKTEADTGETYANKELKDLFVHEEKIYYTTEEKTVVSEEETEYFSIVSVSDFSKGSSAPAVAEALGKYVSSDSAKARAFAAAVIDSGYFTAIPTKANAGTEITLVDTTGLEGDVLTAALNAADGYYVIEEVSLTLTGVAGAGVGNSTKYGDKTAYLLGVFDASEGAVVTVKSSAPSFQKKLKDTNDSTGVTTDWQDSADHDINDDVQFQLKATLPDTYERYKQYQLIFHDNFRNKDNNVDVFTFKQIDRVYVDANGNGSYDDGELELSAYSTENTNGAYAYKALTSATDGYNFEVTINDLTKVYTKGATDTNPAVIVEYTAILNSDAVVGANGNWNDAYLTYTNNPNWKGDGNGTPDTPDTPDDEDKSDTPVDTTVVFTYQTVINKVDKNGGALTGATFTLEKEIKGVNGAANTWKTISQFETIPGSTFTFKGLDDGNYRLTETQEPTGYKKLDAPITFTIEATHTQDTLTEAEKDAKATTLTLTSLTGPVTESNRINMSSLTEDGSLTPVLADGKLSGNVINTSGSTLPSTGGIGTTIFYLGGGCMVAVAGVFLITKKRMGKSEN